MEENMSLSERVAYLRGLMDGISPEDSETARILRAMVEAFRQCAKEIEELSESVDDLCDQVDEIDQDLSIVEDDLYDDEDDDDFEDFDEDAEYYEVVCPKCGDEICVSEDVLINGGVECPACGENLEFDFSTLTADKVSLDDEEDDEENDEDEDE